MQYKYPTVVLDHSNHIETSFLAENTVVVDFSGEDAFRTAKTSWVSTGVPFMLITAADSVDDHYRHLVVSSFACSESSISCTLNITESDTEDVLNEFLADYGQYDELMRKRAEAPWQPGQADLDLDANLGFYSFAEGDFDKTMDDYAEGVDDHVYSHYNDFSIDDDGIFDIDGFLDIILLELYQEELAAMGKQEATRRMVERRNKSNKNKNQGQKRPQAQVQRHAQQKAKANVGSKVLGFLKKIVEAPVKFVQKVVKVATGEPVGMTFQGNGKFPAVLPPPHTDSPFVDGKANPPRKYSTFLIWQAEKEKGNFKGSLSVYCLDCQLDLKYKIAGQVGYNLVKFQATACNAEFSGDIGIALRLGMVAEVKYEKEYTKNILTESLHPFSIPGVLAIGPFVQVGAKVTLSIGAQGTVMGGGTVTTGITYKMDYLDPQNKKRNKAVVRKPEFKPEFNASGEISAGIKLSMPMGLMFGVAVLNGKALALQAGLTFEPGLEAKASIGIKKNLGEKVEMECKGVNVELNAVAQLYFQAEAGIANTISEKTTKYDVMDPLSHKIKSHCFEFKKGKRAIGDNATIEDGTPGTLEPFDWPAEPLESVPSIDFTAGPANSDPTSPELDKGLAAFVGAPESKFSSSLSSDPNNPDESAYNYTIVSSMDGSFDLYGTDQGNLGFVPGETDVSPQDLFAVYDSWVLGDSRGRLLVYFGQEMTKYGVSRIRLEHQDKIPRTSRMVGLFPAKVDGIAPEGLPNAVLLAGDSKGRVFYPVACNYKNDEPTKMFIVEDLDKGIETLESSTTNKIITSGEIEGCDYVALSNGLPGIV